MKVLSLTWNPREAASSATDEVVKDTIPEGRVVEVAPVLLSVVEAGRALGIGRSEVFRLIREGQLKSVRIGRRRLIPKSALDEFVREQLARDEKKEK